MSRAYNALKRQRQEPASLASSSRVKLSDSSTGSNNVARLAPQRAPKTNSRACPRCGASLSDPKSDDGMTTCGCGYAETKQDFQAELPSDKYNVSNIVRDDASALFKQVHNIRSAARSHTRGGRGSTYVQLSAADQKIVRNSIHLKELRLKLVPALKELQAPEWLINRVVSIFALARRKVIEAKGCERMPNGTRRQDLPQEVSSGGKGKQPEHGASPTSSLARESVRWGARTDALGAACIFAALTELGQPQPISRVTTAMRSEKLKVLRQYKLLCRCFPEEYSAVALHDPRFYLRAAFDRLEEFRGTASASSGIGAQVRLSSSTINVLLQADFGAARRFARDFAELASSTLVHIDEAKSDSGISSLNFQPRSAAAAVAMVALEVHSGGCLFTPKQEFSALSRALLAPAENAHGKSAARTWFGVTRKYEALLERAREEATILAADHPASPMLTLARTKAGKLTRAQIVKTLPSVLEGRLQAARNARQHTARTASRELESLLSSPAGDTPKATGKEDGSESEEEVEVEEGEEASDDEADDDDVP